MSKLFNYENILKYPVLRSILSSQMLVIIVGLGTLYFAMYLVFQANEKMTLEKRRQNISFSLSSIQEKWRAWRAMGNDDALDESIRLFMNQHQLDSIEVVPFSDLPDSLSSYDLVIPDTDDGLLSFAVHARLSEGQINSLYNTNWILSVLLLGLGVVFVLFNVSFMRLIKKKIYNPILGLNDAFSKLEEGRDLDVKQIVAEGEMKSFLENIETLQNKKAERDRMCALGELSAQVAHDIRSPLMALSVATKYVEQIPEENRVLIRSAVNRIQGIVSNLENNRDELRRSQLSPQMVAGHIDSIVAEKRVQHMNSDIEFEWELSEQAYGLFAVVEPVAFKRALSNVLNNAFEAISGAGTVRVSLTIQDSSLSITVEDSGCGIPAERLGVVFKKGESDKPAGSGLGLFYARNQVSSWAGRVSIESKVGQGTKVTVILPMATPPSWYAKSIKMSPDTEVFIVDDDFAIHQVWRNRIKNIDNGPTNIHSCQSEDEFVEAFKSRVNKGLDYLVLCDYELGSDSKNGLAIIREWEITDHSVLVTSNHDVDIVREGCAGQNVKLLPKAFSQFVPLQIV